MVEAGVSLPSLVENLGRALANQRVALESSDYGSLEDTLKNAERALSDVLAYPGGVEALRNDIEHLPTPLRNEITQKLDQARIDHQVGSALIRLEMQKSAALLALQASQTDSATYSNAGAVETAAGSLLSRKA